MTSINRLKVPYMPKEELREGLMLEAKNYFPFPVDSAALDFEILGDVVEKGVRKYEITAAASPNANIDRHLDLLKKANIKPASFVPCSYALAKIAGHLPSSQSGEKEKAQCLIDIGKCYTELLIFEGRNLAFSRKLPVSGRDFTKALTAILISERGRTELSLAEAEKIKRETGIPGGGGTDIIDDKISATQVLSMLRAPLERLTSEIERCFDYYREKESGGGIGSVMLFGGGSSLKGLAGFLSERLGMEVKLGDAMEGLKIENAAAIERAEVSHRVGSAVGAALCGAKGINLLPAEIREEAKRIFKRATIKGVVTAVLLASLLLHIGIKTELASLKKRINAARMELSGLQPQLKLAETQILANDVLVNEPHWEDVFKEIGNVIPEDIHLTEINTREKSITMKGAVDSEEEEVLLSNFILNLEKGIFHDVKLVRSEDKDVGKQSITEFEIKCWVD
jgi:type IV pilus assembly protein PilM